MEKIPGAEAVQPNIDKFCFPSFRIAFGVLTLAIMTSCGPKIEAGEARDKELAELRQKIKTLEIQKSQDEKAERLNLMNEWALEMFPGVTIGESQHAKRIACEQIGLYNQGRYVGDVIAWDSIGGNQKFTRESFEEKVREALGVKQEKEQAYKIEGFICESVIEPDAKKLLDAWGVTIEGNDTISFPDQNIVIDNNTASLAITAKGDSLIVTTTDRGTFKKESVTVSKQGDGFTFQITK